MIEAGEFIAAAKKNGFDFFTGVPCSYLTPLINGVVSSSELAYVGAASEGEAVAIASGAWLAGRQAVVICQNSGLGNAVNPLTSLNAPFRIPFLLITTWRGQPGFPDEPQHDVMGQITHELLSLMGLPYAAFPAEPAQIVPALAKAVADMKDGMPSAFVMRNGDVKDERLSVIPLPVAPIGMKKNFAKSGERPTRVAVLEKFLSLVDDQTGVIATTGKSGRELFTLSDRKQQLYQVGSMGGATGMALGVALNSKKKIAVVDGDGAALMKLGTFATVGAYAPKNLIHVLLDNGVHDSTGGQPTVSAHVDFAGVAQACGYAQSYTCDDVEGFGRAWHEMQGAQGPVLLHMRIAPGSMAKLGRPTVKPADVARRFQAFLAE